jgi:hypothetical protein
MQIVFLGYLDVVINYICPHKLYAPNCYLLSAYMNANSIFRLFGCGY